MFMNIKHKTCTQNMIINMNMDIATIKNIDMNNEHGHEHEQEQNMNMSMT